MVCFFSDSSLVRGYLAGYCIQCGLVCFFSDSSFVFIDGFFVGIDVVAVVSNLVGYSFDSLMYCGKAFVGICLVSIDGFFVSIDVFTVCFERRHDTIAYAFCDFFKVFVQTADGIVKSIVGFGLFFQFFSIFIDSFFIGIDVVAVVGNLVGYSFDSIMYCGKAFVGICLVGIDGFFVSIDVFAVCFERRHDTIAYAFCDIFKVFIQTADGIVKSIVSFGLFFQFFSIFIDCFFDVGNFCSGIFCLACGSLSFACGSLSIACCSFCSFYFGIDVLFGFFGRLFGFISYLFGFIGGVDGVVGLSVGFIQ